MNLTDEQKGTMVSEYEAGELATALASKYGVHVKTVHRNLDSRGVKKQTKSYVARKTFGGELDEHAFDILTPEVEYWLGFLFADGNVSGNQLQINLARKDRGHLEKFKAFMKSSTNIYDGINPATDKTPERQYSKFIVGSELLRKKLLEYRLTERKSATADPAECLKKSRDFWRGAVDGDGNVSIQFHKEHVYNGYTYKPRTEASLSLVGSQGMVEAFKAFVEEHIPEAANKISCRQGLYEYRVQGKKAQQLAAILYDNAQTFLDRKYESAGHVKMATLGVPRSKTYRKRSN